MMNRPIIIGVAGGSGSGKTTLADMIISRLSDRKVSLIEEDAYYKSFPNLTLEERKRLNYDHPDAFDHDLLCEHLEKLLRSEPIEKPVYSFITYDRTGETVRVEPAPVIIVEGILVLADFRLRSLLDIKLFVDTDSDVRFIRRLMRDVKERGRTLESVVQQYLEVVRPMHLQFVEPTKRYADLIIPEGGLNQVAVDLIVSRIKG
ncbi:MAG: uridine kinase [Caldiserica bacterium]|jgi:uridine kinase|nr:uridine kinase [Caldisericota bacterium]